MTAGKSASDALNRSSEGANSPDGESPGTPRWVVFLLAALGVTLVAICGVCGGGLYYFSPELANDPEQAVALTDQIATVDVPEPFQPAGIIDWNLAFVMQMRGAYYEIPPDDGLLMLIAVRGPLVRQESIRDHVDRTLRETGGGATPLVTDESATRQISTAAGSEVPFEFEKATDPDTGAAYRIVEGVVTGPDGSVLVALRVKQEQWNEQSIVEMLRSIAPR
ncbi:hypothetical protein Mal4_31370 [Maioricimonas rarisocia]|uniref:PsbP C-terminal domain-containing protein n=1 Tax=Maioricimonas rarisocia TaxID=2528026 RepID=A0A517Z8J1_9PLAN|nr:hypothetical protein [Maioricimonas rarisocia]QDU38807.1 hypothetical protein Mal4_31370 [Maioricimonas rarisocia]